MDGLLSGIFALISGFLRFSLKTLFLLGSAALVIHHFGDPARKKIVIEFPHKQKSNPAVISRAVVPQPSSDSQRPLSAGMQSLEPNDWFKKVLARAEKERNALAVKAKQNVRFSAAPMATEPEKSYTKERAAVGETKRASDATTVKRSLKKTTGRAIQFGKASFYGGEWNGRKTASGEVFDASKFTAAHKTLPFGTYVRVVRKDNNRAVVVRINDRGPFKSGRIIDLSTAGARSIKMIDEGVVDVALYPASVVDFLQQFKR